MGVPRHQNLTPAAAGSKQEQEASFEDGKVQAKRGRRPALKSRVCGTGHQQLRLPTAAAAAAAQAQTCPLAGQLLLSRRSPVQQVAGCLAISLWLQTGVGEPRSHNPCSLLPCNLLGVAVHPALARCPDHAHRLLREQLVPGLQEGRLWQWVQRLGSPKGAGT